MANVIFEQMQFSKHVPSTSPLFQEIKGFVTPKGSKEIVAEWKAALSPSATENSCSVRILKPASNDGPRSGTAHLAHGGQRARPEGQEGSGVVGFTVRARDTDAETSGRRGQGVLTRKATKDRAGSQPCLGRGFTRKAGQETRSLRHSLWTQILPASLLKDRRRTALSAGSVRPPMAN